MLDLSGMNRPFCDRRESNRTKKRVRGVSFGREHAPGDEEDDARRKDLARTRRGIVRVVACASRCSEGDGVRGAASRRVRRDVASSNGARRPEEASGDPTRVKSDARSRARPRPRANAASARRAVETYHEIEGHGCAGRQSRARSVRRVKWRGARGACRSQKKNASTGETPARLLSRRVMASTTALFRFSPEAKDFSRW